MDLLKKKWIKKGNLKVTKSCTGMLVENTSDTVGYLYYPRVFSENKTKTIYLDFEGKLVEGKTPEVCVENRRKAKLVGCILNSSTNVTLDVLKYYFIKISVPSNSKIEIAKIEYDERIKDDYNDYINSDTLMIVSFDKDNYKDALKLDKAYSDHGFYVDTLFVDNNQGFSIIREGNLKLLRCNYNELREILRNKVYKQIIIHHNYDSVAAIIDATDLSATLVDVYCYGDALESLKNSDREWIFGEFVDGVFKQTHKSAFSFIPKNNESKNYRWIFENESIKEQYEKNLNIKFNNYAISNIFTIEREGVENMVLENIALYRNRKPYQQEFTIIPEKPILSVVVPSYNVSKYLKHTIYSLVNQKNAKYIEILIVNDGSRDDTLELAEELREKYSYNGESIIKIIDKENGGHGSTLNVGFKSAKGKYVKVVDGDDTLNSYQFEKLIDYLKHEESDIVLTNYIEDWERYGQLIYKKIYHGLDEGKIYSFDNLCDGTFVKMGPVMATSTYRTEMIREAGFKISEKMPYVDMELNTYIATIASTVSYYNLNIYKYLLGRRDQTVSNESVLRNYKKHETICFNIIDIYYQNWDRLSQSRRDYIKNVLILPMLGTQYFIVGELNNKQSIFDEFDTRLKDYPEFYKEVLNIKKEVIDYRKLGIFGAKLKYMIRRMK